MVDDNVWGRGSTGRAATWHAFSSAPVPHGKGASSRSRGRLFGFLRRPRQLMRLPTDQATSRIATVPSVTPKINKRSDRVWSTNLKLAWNSIDALAILPKTWCSCRESGIFVHALCMDICSSKEGSAPLSRSDPGSHFLPLGLCSLNPSVSKDARTGMLRLNLHFCLTLGPWVGLLQAKAPRLGERIYHPSWGQTELKDPEISRPKQVGSRLFSP